MNVQETVAPYTTADGRKDLIKATFETRDAKVVELAQKVAAE